MSDHLFVDYIKQEMCGEHIPVSEAHEEQSHDLQPPELPTHHAVDALALLTRDNIRTIEDLTQPRWSQLQWGDGQWGSDNPVLKTEHQEGEEEFSRPGTLSEASLSTSSGGMWSPVGSSSDGSSNTTFGINGLLVGPANLRRQSDDSLFVLESLFPDLPLFSSNFSSDDAQDPNEAQASEECVGMFEHEQIPVASPCFEGRPGMQTSYLKPDLSRAGKPTRKKAMVPPRKKKKVKYSMEERRSQSGRFHAKGPKTLDNSFRHPLKLEVVSPDIIPSVPVSRVIANQWSTLPLPETSDHHTAISTRSPSRATGYNLRTKPLAGVQPETKLFKTPSERKTLMPSTTGEHQRRSTKNTGPPQEKGTTSMHGDFAVQAHFPEMVTVLGKRSFQPSDEDSDSDTQPSQDRKSNQEPPKSRELKLNRTLSEAEFTIENDVLHCPCRMTFPRVWDAMRHWKNSSTHKMQRLRKGDASGLLENFCTECEQFFARKDSLKRHIPNCGMRKKRKGRIRMDPAGNVELVDG